MPVIISDDLVITTDPDTGDFPLSHARIGYQSLPRTADSLIVSSTASGFFSQAPANGLTYEYWRPSSLPAHWGIDAGENVAVDYVGIAAHELGSTGCAAQVQHSDDGSTWTDIGNDQVPADNRPLMFLFTRTEARYWRVHISGGSDTPRVGVIYIGRVLQMMRPIYGNHSPGPLNRTTVIDPNTSENGQWLGRSIRRTGVSTSANFRHLKPDWYRTYFDPFVLSARLYPFFFAWRPSKYPEDVVFAWTSGDIQPENMGTRDLMEVSFDMAGLGGYE